MLQMADARTSGTAVTRIFSILEVNGRDENKAFDYMKKLRPNVQLYTKSGGGGTLPVGLGQAGGGIFFIVDALDTKAKGYDVTISFPKEGIGTAAEGIALIKGAKNPELGKKLIDWATSPAMQNQFAKYKINFVPAHPDVALEPSLAAVLKGAKHLSDRRGLRGRESQAHRRSLGRRSPEPLSRPARPLAAAAGSARRDRAPRLGAAIRRVARARWSCCGRCSRCSSSTRWRCCSARVLFDHGAFTTAGIAGDPDRPAPDPRVLEQPAARAAGRRRRHGPRLSVRVHRGARAAAALAAHGDRRGVLLPLVSPPFTTAIAMIFSFGPRGLITYELLGLKGVTVYGLTSTLFSEVLTYFPIAYLTLRPLLAAIDSNIEGMALSLGASRWRVFRTVTLPLAHPRARQCVPAAVRRIARRLRDAADPRRQSVSRCCRRRRTCRSPACSTCAAARRCRSCCSCRRSACSCCSATGSAGAST